jgi:hypothetical protein
MTKAGTGHWYEEVHSASSYATRGNIRRNKQRIAYVLGGMDGDALRWM